MKKKFPLLLLTLALSLPSFAQIVQLDTVKVPESILNYPIKYHNKTYQYSVAVKTFGIEQFPKVLHQVNSDDFIHTSLNGIMFKINDNQISYRFGGNFYHKDFSFRNECSECEIANGKLTDYTVSLGFEKAISYSTLQPYFGFDLGFRRNQFKGSVNDLIKATSYQANTIKNGGFLAPLIGFRLNVIDHVAVAVEGSMDIYYSSDRQEKTLTNEAHTQTVTNPTGWEILLKPVSMLTLQYNFGNID